MPRPPPPAIALITIAAPLPRDSKNAVISSSDEGPLVPAMIGTPQRLASCRAATLSPNSSSAAGIGPRARDADGDLATVGDQEFLERHAASPCPRAEARVGRFDDPASSL